MTARDPNDLRDARVDAAWRAASREEPPPALDDAIRAAARREIGAGPHRIDAQQASVSDSLRPQRWWWPLAAAATVGAIAIGVLQLTDPERIAVAGDDKAVVSDTPPAPAGAKKQESGVPAQEQAPASPPATIAPAPSSAASEPTAMPAARAPGKPMADELRTREAPASASALRKDATPAALPRDERGAADAVAPPAASEPRAATHAAAPAPAVAQPFPGDAPKREANESKLDGAAPAAGSVAPPPAPAAQADAPREAQRASAGVAGFASAPGAVRQAPAAEADRAYHKEASGILQAQDTKGRAKALPSLSVPDWIARIRRFRDEGRTEDAARELAEFRKAHPDHEQLLPPDLRTWRPAAP